MLTRHHNLISALTSYAVGFVASQHTRAVPEATRPSCDKSPILLRSIHFFAYGINHQLKNTMANRKNQDKKGMNWIGKDSHQRISREKVHEQN